MPIHGSQVGKRRRGRRAGRRNVSLCRINSSAETIPWQGVGKDWRVTLCFEKTNAKGTYPHEAGLWWNAVDWATSGGRGKGRASSFRRTAIDGSHDVLSMSPGRSQKCLKHSAVQQSTHLRRSYLHVLLEKLGSFMALCS